MSFNPNPPLEISPPSSQPEPPSGPPPLPVEDPPWNGWDVLLLAVAAVVAINIFVSIAVTIYVAVYSSTHPDERMTPLVIQRLTFNPYVLVSGQFLAYVTLVALMIWLVRRRYQRPFWESVQWHWPGLRWPVYLIAGVTLAVVVQSVLRFLPVPKSLPIQRYFESTQGAYLMAVFGILVAPLVEELFFRGFLYPALGRGFARALYAPEKASSWASLALLYAGWALIMRSLAGIWVLAAALAPLIGWAIFFPGNRKQPATGTVIGIVNALFLVVWGLLMRVPSRTVFWVAAGACLLIAVLLMAACARRGMAANAAAFGGAVISIFLTAAGFALIHAAQLASSIAPLAMLFTVGMVITLMRALTRSVAVGLLMHVGYNATLFFLFYLATDHFRNLQRMSQ